MMKPIERRLRFGRTTTPTVPRLSAIFAVVLAGSQMASTPASAQFVCQDATTGTADGATASVTGSVACGTGASASGPYAVATGKGAKALNSDTTATGYFAEASGLRGTAIGSSSFATGDDSTATGTSAVASGLASTAMGRNARATHANSAAFGAGAQTTAANQMMFGTASNTYTLNGVASAASKAAQSGPVQIVTSDSAGNLATMEISALGGGADLSEINGRLDEHDRKIAKNTEGVAIALAMAGVPTLTHSETFAMSANWGTFEGENGFAAGGAVRVNRNIQLNGGVGFGGDTVGGRAGVRVGW